MRRTWSLHDTEFQDNNYLTLNTQFSTFAFRSYDLYQDLSYVESLSGQPGAWLVKKKNYLHATTKLKKRTSY